MQRRLPLKPSPEFDQGRRVSWTGRNAMSIAVNKLGESIGVEITGMTGDQLVSRSTAHKTKALLGEHGVVVYREVHIDDDDLLAFTRMLGTPVVQPTGEHEYPEIQTITSDPSKTSKVMAEYRK